MRNKLLIAGFALLHSISYSQVNPVVTGDTMLCPEGTGMLTTGNFDTYQWFQRYYGSEDTFAIAGATSQELEMTAYDFSGSYVMVEVTENGISGQSEEILVDGYVFAGPTVSIGGEFETGQNGESIICQGDTLILQFLQPYTQNIVWFNDGTAIMGETDSILYITTAGSYTVSGSPEVCPDFTAAMGVPVEVFVDNCGLSIDENNLFAAVYPNPASEKITITVNVSPADDFRIIDQSGRAVKCVSADGLTTSVDISGLEAGIYFIECVFDNKKELERFVVK